MCSSDLTVDFKDWYNENVSPDFAPCRQRIANLLREESQLMEIVKLIGSDILPENQKLIMETARLIRLGFLQQNSYNPVDTYVPLKKQLLMMQTILRLYDGVKEGIDRSIPLSQYTATGIFDTVVKMKYEIPNEDLSKFDDYAAMIDKALEQVNTANS